MSGDAGIQRIGSLIRQLQGALGGNRIVAGTVSASGAIVSGKGFAVSRTSVGHYTVTFSPAFGAVPAVVALPVAAGAAPWTSALEAVPAAGGFNLRNVAGGADADLAFSFTAAGPA